MPLRLALAAVATFAFGGDALATASPGSWATVAQIERTLKAQPLTLAACAGCVYDSATNSYLPPGTYVDVHVVNLTVRGLGATTRIGGTARYKVFDVRVCAIDYQQGGAKVSAHLLWHTASILNIAARRAALEAEFKKIRDAISHGGDTTTLERQGQKIAAELQNMQSTQTAAAAYGQDWATGGWPAMHEGC